MCEQQAHLSACRTNEFAFGCLRLVGGGGGIMDFADSQSVVGYTSSSPGAVQLAEPRQRDASTGVDIAVGALVHPLDQVLLVQQRVVGAKRAGGVNEVLVVMAELRLPARGQELVHVHHLAQ